jgi:hypothetical protein
MRRFFTLTTVASGAALGMIVAGVLALIGGAYDHKVVRDQLRPQQISFPEKGKELPASLNEFAGERVDTASEAKAYADDFIALHLKGVAGGKTYSQVSAAFLEDPTNEKLAQQRQTLFMGETLRGLLLQAWGWGTIGTIATIAGIALIALGGLLLLIPLLAAYTARQGRTSESVRAAEPTAA